MSSAHRLSSGKAFHLFTLYLSTVGLENQTIMEVIYIQQMV